MDALSHREEILIGFTCYSPGNFPAFAGPVEVSVEARLKANL